MWVNQVWHRHYVWCLLPTVSVGLSLLSPDGQPAPDRYVVTFRARFLHSCVLFLCICLSLYVGVGLLHHRPLLWTLPKICQAVLDDVCFLEASPAHDQHTLLLTFWSLHPGMSSGLSVVKDLA